MANILNKCRYPMRILLIDCSTFKELFYGWQTFSQSIKATTVAWSMLYNMMEATDHHQLMLSMKSYVILGWKYLDNHWVVLNSWLNYVRSNLLCISLSIPTENRFLNDRIMREMRPLDSVVRIVEKGCNEESIMIRKRDGMFNYVAMAYSTTWQT